MTFCGQSCVIFECQQSRDKAWPLLLRLLLVVVCLLLMACAGNTPEQHRREQHRLVIAVYDYHTYPPYVMDNDRRRGLSAEWVKFLNRHLSNARLQLTQIDRPSLNALLQSGKPMLVLWANPTWFRRFPQLKPSVPILVDGDMLVSSLARPVKELMPNARKRLCSIKGYVYPTIEPWVQNGALQTVERASTQECIEAIQQNTADVALMNRSQWLYIPLQEREKHWFMIPEPIDAFARHMLVSSEYEALLPEINAAIIAVNNDLQWQHLLVEYGSQDFLNLFDLRLEQLQTLPLPKT